MSGTNLLGELRQASYAIRQPHLDRLRALGVSLAWLATYPTHPVGIAPCEPNGAGLYQPGEGQPHLILPVLEEGALIDLVAFRTTDPAGWMLRTGNGMALGLEDGLEPWTWYSPQEIDRTGKITRHQVGKPTHLFSDPLDWMQGRGEGLCVVNWSAPDLCRLDVLPRVVTDRATAALLTAALRRPVHVPQIEIREVPHALAA